MVLSFLFSFWLTDFFVQDLDLKEVALKECSASFSDKLPVVFGDAAFVLLCKDLCDGLGADFFNDGKQL